MGGKRTRTRKLVYFCSAGLTALLFSGCAVVDQTVPQDPARQNLLKAQELLALQDYAGAAAETAKALSRSGTNTPGDEALFNLGVIYSHPDNPKKDYDKALELFRKVLEDYPQSPWGERAKSWIGLLQDYAMEQQTIKKLREEHNQSATTIHRLREESSQTIKKLKEENDNLNLVIKKLKQVDIEIEERKKERAR